MGSQLQGVSEEATGHCLRRWRCFRASVLPKAQFISKARKTFTLWDWRYPLLGMDGFQCVP